MSLIKVGVKPTRDRNVAALPIGATLAGGNEKAP